MPDSSNMAVRFRDFLLRWRWWIAAAAALLTIFVELVEHGTASLSSFDPAFLREILLFGVFGPLLAGIALTVLRQAWTERSTAVTQMSQQRELGQQLAHIQDWTELTAFIVKYPRSLVPVAGVGLFVYDQLSGGYRLSAEWWDPALDPAPTPAFHQTPSFCGTCVVSHVGAEGHPLPLRCVDSARMPDWGNRYCLPLMRGTLPIAFLYLYFRVDVVLSVEEVNLLGGIAPAIAIAIHDARPQRSAVIQAEAAGLERKRIARDLHDTLGQSLAYLHLKLDQLTGDDALREIVAIRQELERMRDVANDSYQKVRATLDDLRLSPESDLASALQERANLVAQRAGVKVELSTEGQPLLLPTDVQRHILYIFREALTNVEKHAGARRIRFHLTWTDHALTIRLSEDGRGFDVETARRNGHYGLAIMQERAKEIGGQLEIASSPGSGTEILFSLALARDPSPSGDDAS